MAEYLGARRATASYFVESIAATDGLLIAMVWKPENTRV
jgi:hypothetical protein